MRTVTILSLFLLAINQLNAQETDTIIDPRDGQVYNIVIIGDQWWMAENLKATKYSDGTPLIDGAGVGDITGDNTTKYYFWYGDDSASFAETYGALYTWAAAMDGAASSINNPSDVQGVCPTGWHMPSDAEWKELELYLGMSQAEVDGTGQRGTDEGGKLRETGTTHWISPNTGATNSSGFTALSGGFRHPSGSYVLMGETANFWSSSENTSAYAWHRLLDYDFAGMTRWNNYDKEVGFSVRCLRNVFFPPDTIISEPGDQKVTLRWSSDQIGNLAKYRIFRDGNLIDSVEILGINDTVYVDSGLVNYTEYSYYITSLDTIGNESRSSDTISAIPSEIVEDYDENFYGTIKIGDQFWMRENLKTTHYADGTPLVNGTGVGNIQGDYTTKYYFWYGDDSTSYAGTYGALYTWAAAMNGAVSRDANPSGIQGVCPNGWHLPSDDEWKELEMFLGMSQAEADLLYEIRGTDEGGKLKETGTTHWNSPNTGATNSSGFTALPGGYRQDFGNSLGMGSYAEFWSSTEHPNVRAISRRLNYNNSEVSRYPRTKDYGYSVRCLKDFAFLTISVDTVDFGVIDKSIADTTQFIYLKNPDTSSFVIDSIVGVDSPFALDLPDYPGLEDIGIAAGDSALLNITLSTGNYEGIVNNRIRFYSNPHFISVILKADIPSEIIVEDYDGNTYNTQLIGDQIWMRENLKTTHYADGTPLLRAANNSDWDSVDINDRAYCWYDYDSTSYAATYGALYTWAAAMNGAASSINNPSGVQGVCPDGWHLPSDAEWKELEMHLGMSQAEADGIDWRGTEEGGKLKATGLTHWESENVGATNSSGFTALPGGYSDYGGSNMGFDAYFWSSTMDDYYYSWTRVLDYSIAEVNRETGYKVYGYSVRCLKDIAFLNVSADNVDFGIVDKSIADTTRYIYLKNPDTSNFVIDSIVGVDPPFALDLPDYPGLEDISIAAGDSTQLNITLSTGNFEGIFKSRIWFHSDDHYTSVNLYADIPSEIIVVDYDGNTYNTQSIGDQVWMRENLKTTHYADGTPISNVTTDSEWNALVSTDKAYCWYENDSTVNAAIYGALYTWAAAMNGEASSDANPSGVQGICPEGWYLPSDADWKELEMFLGMSQSEADTTFWRGTVEGDQLKEIGTTYWAGNNTSATNSSSFTALPGDKRENDGWFEGLGSFAYFWSSSEYDSDYSWVRRLYSGNSGVSRNTEYKKDGHSVRCLKVKLNLPPVADVGPDQDVNEGDTVTLDGQGSSDPDGDSLIFIWTASAALTLSDTTSASPTFIAPEVIADTIFVITLVVNDSSLDSDPDTVLVTVRQLNKVPEITGQELLITDEDTGLTLMLSDFTITDGDNDTADMVLLVQDGTDYSHTGNTITPNADYYGTLTVPVRVTDPMDTSLIFNASVSVTAINDPPEIISQNAVSSEEDMPFDIQFSDLVINDPDNDTSEMSLTVYDSVNYSVSGTTVIPDPDFSDTIIVYISVSDTSNTSNVFLMTATITPVNDAPIVSGQNPISATEDMPFDILWSDLIIDDPDNDSTDFIILITDSTNYTFSGTTVTPDEDFNGTLYIPLQVSDGSETSNSFVTSVSIVSENDAPQIAGQNTISAIEDSSFVIRIDQLLVTDPDNVPADFSITIFDSLNYSVSDSIIIPDTGFTGTLSIPVTVSDGMLSSDVFVLEVNVLPKMFVTYTKTDLTIIGGHNGWIDLSVSGGIPPYSYDWNTGAFTQDIFFLYAGMYTVTVADAGIQSITRTIEITQPPPVQECDITVDFSYEIDSLTQEVSFSPSNTEYELFWAFDDGNCSSLASPVYMYSRPGLYQVCLTAYDESSDCSFDTCKMIEVGSPECIADFNFYVDQSDSMLLHFSDNSHGAVSSWYWNFADGTTSTDQDADHMFSQAGTYQVCLFTLDSTTGCLSEACREITIGSVELVADFSYFVNPVTLKATFTNNSFGNITDYYWTYGDGNVFTDKQGSYEYTDPGLYNVCLSVRNSGTGMFTKICKNLKVGTLSCNLSADFSYFVDPVVNMVNFRNISSGTVHSYFWNFGDGTSSSSASPVHQFSKPGYYMVSLSIRDTIANCTDFQAKLIQVGQAGCKALFKYSVDPARLSVTLEDISQGDIDSYFWTFDDGTTSMKSDPVHTYSAAGLYEISLTVTDVTGSCMDYIAIPVQVGSVDCSADFTVFIDSPDNTAYFSSRSFGSMINYHWIFSDGKMSAERNPVHTFSVPGYHKVSLNTYNELSGCMDYNEQIILIGSQGIDCEADFIYRTDESTHKVRFGDKSLGEGLTWFWNFGDRKSSTPTSTLRNPQHQYSKGGIYNVCLTVYSSSGIQNTSCKQVFAGPPAAANCLAQFIYTIDNTDLTVNYKDEAFGEPDTWLWEFGDDQSSRVKNPSHEFGEAGYYTTRQQIMNQATGCISDAFDLININMEGGLIAGFGYTIDSTSIKAESYPVDYVGVSLGDANKFKWDFGDGSYDSTTTTPTHIYDAPGKYYVCLTIYDDVTGAEDTKCDSVIIGGLGVGNYLESLPAGQDIALRCYPNPADDIYYVLLDLPAVTFTEVTVYTISGIKLRSLVCRKLNMGRHLFELDATDMPSGLYIIKLNSNIRMVTQILSIQH